MSAEAELTPTSYIQHHLKNLTTQVGEGGFWVLVGSFEGALDAWRFENVTYRDPQAEPRTARRWEGPARNAWRSSAPRWSRSNSRRPTRDWAAR